MKRAGAAIAFVAVALGAAAARAQPKQVAVTVVDQAGGTVFLEPGEDAGLHPGAEVRFGKKTYRVQAVTATAATISVGARVLPIGSRGQATITARAGGPEKALAKPAPLASFAGQWPEATVPAASQSPTPVPIGQIRARGPSELAIRASSSSLFPLRGGGEPVTRVSLRAQLRFEPFAEVPFGLDADVEAARWFGRGLSGDLGAGSRPTIEVQELRLRYGDRDDPGVGLGRLRYASRSVGLLDGARVSSPRYAGVSAFAFGGVVPSTLDGAFDTSLARFGAGASYIDVDSSWRPSAELTAWGSLFEGELDERRLAANVRLYPGPATLGAHAELSGFAADNPWGQDRVEITAAGVDAGISYKRLTASASLDALQPERSLWLASLLPQSWLCTAEPLPAGAGPEPCDGRRDTSYYGLATAGFDTDHLALRAGGTAILDNHQSLEQRGAFLDVHALDLLAGAGLELGATAAESDLLDSYAARIGASSSFGRSLDASLYYRPALLVYQASVEDIVEHRVGGELFWAPAPSWGGRLSAEGVQGDDISMVGVYATAVWRGAL